MTWLIRLILIQGTVAPAREIRVHFAPLKLSLAWGILHFTGLQLVEFGSFFGVKFTAFMVIGRLVCGVHWFSDIFGGLIFSVAMILLYYTANHFIE